MQPCCFFLFQLFHMQNLLLSTIKHLKLHLKCRFVQKSFQIKLYLLYLFIIYYNLISYDIRTSDYGLYWTDTDTEYKIVRPLILKILDFEPYVSVLFLPLVEQMTQLQPLRTIQRRIPCACMQHGKMKP